MTDLNKKEEKELARRAAIAGISPEMYLGAFEDTKKKRDIPKRYIKTGAK